MSASWPIRPWRRAISPGNINAGHGHPGPRTTLFERGQRYEKPGAEVAIDAYLDLARDLGVDLVQLSVAFVTSRKFVTSNIIGATNLAQLDAVLGSIDIVITPEIEARINAIHQVHQNPCP